MNQELDLRRRLKAAIIDLRVARAQHGKAGTKWMSAYSKRVINAQLHGRKRDVERLMLELVAEQTQCA